MLDYRVNVYLRHTEMENMYMREMIDIVAQDTRAYTFKFTLYDDESAYNLTGRNVYLIVKSTSGTIVQEKCTVTDITKGLAQITLPNDMFCEEGIYCAEVQIWEGTNRLTSLPFDYIVRLSLQSNRSVIADTRYSLLQEALENVAEADGKSTEALTTANKAKTLADSQINTINTASQNAQEALNRATSVVTQEEFAEKVLLNGASTNVNFIENKVVQDGLIYVGGYNDKKAFSPSDNTLMLKMKNLKVSSLFNISCLNWGTFEGYGVDINATYLQTFVLDGTKQVKGDIKTHKFSLDSVVTIITKDKSIYVFENGKLITSQTGDMYRKSKLTPIVSSLYIQNMETIVQNDKVLTPQEIQHNLSVLNNTPSISSLETSDKTSFLIGTKTDLIQTRTGHTEEERYTALLSKFGKKYTSSGEDITVANGIENQRVLSAKISGQTVKCIEKTSIATIPNTLPFTTTSAGKSKLDWNNQYYLIFEVENLQGVGGTIELLIGSNYPNYAVKNGKNIIKLNKYNLVASIGYIAFKNFTDGQLTTQMVVVEEGFQNIATPNISIGLNSTQATITNNGLKYSFYSLTDDKLNNRAITLGGIGDVRDTLELKEDGNAVLTQNTKEIILTGAEDWRYFTTNGVTTYASIFETPFSSYSTPISSTLPSISFNDTITKQGVASTSGVGSLVVSFNASEVTTLEELKAKVNGMRVRAKLATPIVTTIDKSLVPAILTQATNKFTFGDAVKPSGVEITVPVDKVTDLETRLAQVEKVITSVSNLSLQANYAEDEYNNLINQL